MDTSSIVNSLIVPSSSTSVAGDDDVHDDELLDDHVMMDQSLPNIAADPPSLVNLLDNAVSSKTVSSKTVSDAAPLANVTTAQPDAVRAAGSWASKLKPCAKGMPLSFVYSDDSVASIDLDDIETEIKYWDTTLVGSFLGSKHSLSSVHSYVKQFWNNVSCPEVLYLRKGWFYFKFVSKDDCLSVLHGGPWVFGNSTLILKKWTPDFCSQLESVKVVPVWTIFSDLDPCFWSSNALSKIASLIGKPLFADPYTTDKTRISFARVLIDIDVSKDTPSFVTVRSPFGVQNVKVEYEWIPHYCTHCESLGHSVNRCRKKKPHVQTQQVWRPVQRDTDLVKDAKVDDTLGVDSVEKAINDAIPLDVSMPRIPAADGTVDPSLNSENAEGFTKVHRKSTSPRTPHRDKSAALPQQNTFDVLSSFSDSSDNAIMERGGASQAPS